MKNQKLLVICGPTSSGKTKLALQLSKLLNGEIISADSRQVYKMMDIGTGKGLPTGSQIAYPNKTLKKKNIGCYKIEGVDVWGYDLVDPKKEFSVSQYIKIANNIIQDMVKRKKLPILAGGTGLYIRGVVDGIESAIVPRNKELREALEKKSVEELLEMLSVLNPIKAARLNQSDRKNERRLVRAIEIARWKLSNGVKKFKKNNNKYDTFFVGLISPLPFLEKKIQKRVLLRYKKGQLKEIKKLLNYGVSWKMQSMNTLGYKEWLEYVNGREDKNKVLQNWTKDERKYAKRQITWFKKDSRVNWFDITNPSWQKRIEKKVKKWHNEIHAEED